MQIDSNARITSTFPTIVCSIINWSIGIIDPLVYLIRRKEFREEVKNLFIFKVSPKKTGMAKGIVLESPLKYWTHSIASHQTKLYMKALATYGKNPWGWTIKAIYREFITIAATNIAMSLDTIKYEMRYFIIEHWNAFRF